MFENLKNGWRLGSAIRKLVFQDKKLLAYPVISGIVILVETLVIFLSLFITSFAGLSVTTFIVGLFIFYVVVYFTSVYILVAMLLAFKSFETKKPMGIFASLGKTAEYTVVIFEWAVFEAIVVMVIRAIEQRLGSIAGLVFGFLASFAISVATLFAIPVIVDKKTGPISTLKESTNFIMHNFGKTFGGLLYTDLYSLIFILLGVVIAIGAVFAWAAGAIPFAVGAVIGVIGVAVFAFGSMLSYTLSNVYKLVLYDYMNSGKLPDGIDAKLMKSGIKQKQNSQNSGTNLPGGFV